MVRPMYFVMCTALMVSPCLLPRSERRYAALPALIGATGLLVSVLNYVRSNMHLTEFVPSHDLSEAVADPGNHLEPTLTLD
jgi:hypothetical protein